nr:hypothetical protein [Burkholderiaceae bacterium]
HAKNVQNGLMTRNEVRQLENLQPDPSPMADALTVQSNLVPIDMLGEVAEETGSVPEEPVMQSALLRYAAVQERRAKC